MYCYLSQMATATSLQSSADVPTSQVVCHDRYGRLNASDFARRACSLCYVYLFPSRRPAYVAAMPDYIYLMPVIGILATQNWTTHDEVEVGSFDYDSPNESTIYRENRVQVEMHGEIFRFEIFKNFMEILKYFKTPSLKYFIKFLIFIIK